MSFLEKDLEDIIFETDNDLLFEHGLFIDGQKKRQVRIGNYGIADLITCRGGSRFAFSKNRELCTDPNNM